VLAEAFIGPSSYQIRKDLAARAPVVATVKHGEKVGILGRRRLFFRIRTESGAEGWINGRLLLAAEDMQSLKELEARMAKAPSMGSATVFDVLNVHTQPHRQAPSFIQIPPDGVVDVLGRQLVERVAFLAPELIPQPPARPARKKKERKQSVPPPPRPAPPGLPSNWRELSGNPVYQPPPPPPPVPAVYEDWTLIRNKEGRVGWVLSRLLYMAIPEEVAQYAERSRITSYFALGYIADKDSPEGRKAHWLWTTIAGPPTELDFDSVRVFTWNPRRSRYETAFIDRNLSGYHPVTVQHVPNGGADFTLYALEKDGSVNKRTSSFNGTRVRLINKTPAQRPPPLYRPPDPKPAPVAQPGAATSQSIPSRIKGWLGSLVRRIRG